MTWYETLYWWSFLVVPIISLVLFWIFEDEGILPLIPFYWISAFILGMVSMAIVSENTEYVTTAIVEKIPLSVTKTDFGLDMVTDEGEHIRFTNYKDIKDWENGAKLYKVYSYKKVNFGWDLSKSKSELVMRKSEQ